jgi:hypothetical protein
MFKRDPKPIERHPRGVILPHGWQEVQNVGFAYRPKDKPIQEDWGTVARKFNFDVQELIRFNFMTNDPDEVNWYLHYHTGCNKVSPSGNNWMFSNSAKPGLIYIPNAKIDFDAEQLCSWMPSEVKKFMLRLVAISQGMSGYDGERIKKLVQVMVRAGYPGSKNLWFYQTLPVLQYINMWNGNAMRREMTKTTQGAFPFDGDSGTHGPWKIYPVADLLDEFACGHWDPAALKHRLQVIDNDMYQGWYAMSQISGGRTTQGGESLYGELVWEFINHVKLLSEDDTHLYSAFRP